MTNNSIAVFKKKVGLSLIVLGVIVTAVFGVILFKASAVSAAEYAAEGVSDKVMCWAFLAAAISVGVGSLGAGIAVAYVGAAAMGVLGEKPELAGRALIFVALAEGVAIYGLIIAMIILFKLG